MVKLYGKELQVILAILLSIIIIAALWFQAQPFVVMLLWLFFIPTVISFLSGLVRGLLFKEWSTLKFAYMIVYGNFIFEKHKTFPNGIKTILSRLFWEQPQTFMGNFGMHLLNSVWLIFAVDTYKRALVCQGYFLNGGGIALGSFIMIDLQKSPVVNINPMDERSVPERVLIRHEYGHLLQSISSGPLYIFKYGIPSILTQGWTEVDADYRSDRELLLTEQILPVFNNHRSQTKSISPRWWEFVMLAVLITGGWLMNNTNGAVGGALIATMAITALNLRKPV
jgi:hypothetical protein